MQWKNSSNLVFFGVERKLLARSAGGQYGAVEALREVVLGGGLVLSSVMSSGAQLQVLNGGGSKGMYKPVGLSYGNRQTLCKHRKMLSERLGWSVDDDLTKLQREQRLVLKPTLQKLKGEGKVIAWRGATIVERAWVVVKLAGGGS